LYGGGRAAAAREGELIVVQPERDTERISSGRAANRGRDQRGVEVVRTIMAAPPVREMRARLGGLSGRYGQLE
jgi:hypothetical protein